MPGNAIVVNIIGNVSGFNKSMDQAIQKVSLAKVAFASMNMAISAFKTAMMAGAASILALTLPTIIATNAIKDYDANMRRFLAVTGTKATVSQMTALNDQFNKLAITYGESADNVAAMAIEFGKAGFSADTVSKQLLEPALQLAIANQMDSATAAEIATYAWQLWGKEVGSFSKMANMMHVAASESILDVEDLGEAFQYVGSSAVLNNITFQQFLALAGGVSQIAGQMGESFRSLFINMMLNGQQLADTLNAPEIMTNGKVNLMNLVAVLKEGNFTIEQWNAAMELWGLRPATNLNQIRLTASEIERIFASLGEDVNALPAAAEMMSMSLDRLMQSIMEVIISPLRTVDVMETLRTALSAIRDALTGPAFTSSLKEVIITSATFVKESGPQLIRMVQELIKLFISAIPIMKTLASFFLIVANLALKGGLAVGVFVYSGMQFIKIAPQWAAWMVKIGSTTEFATLQMFKLSMSVSMILAGFTLIATSSNTWAKALGVLIVAIGALVAVTTAFAIAHELAEKGVAGIVTSAIMVAAIIGGVAAVAGSVGLAAVSMGNTPTPNIPSTTGTISTGTGYTNTTTSSTVTNIGEVNQYLPPSYEVNKDDFDSLGGERT
jgi:hypothetical protein